MAAKTKFRGSFTALVTPFKNGSLDEAAFRGLVSWQIEQGSHGLVPVGTTGESPTLSHDEHHRVVEMCIDEAKGRVPVIAGAGSNSTREAVDLAVHAEKAGADAVLVVTPYYNKPTQEGMYQHFKAVNDAIGIPIIIYNIPPRSVVDMSVETMTRLFELKNIAGVKDATANLARVSQQRHAMGPDFIQLSGEDMTALAYMAAGGHGCISVVANVAPKLCADLMSAVMKGDYATGLKIQDRLTPLHDAVFKEPGLAGAKHGLKLLGRLEEEVRLPLMNVTPPTGKVIRDAMVHAGPDQLGRQGFRLKRRRGPQHAEGIPRIRDEGQRRRPRRRRHHRCGLRRHRDLAGRRHHHADHRRDHRRSRLLQLFHRLVEVGDGDQSGRRQKAGRGTGLGQFPDADAELHDHRFRAVHGHSRHEPAEAQGRGGTRGAAEADAPRWNC
jgi:4-hydroxy-tetrahydrodipicolinate synthase